MVLFDDEQEIIDLFVAMYKTTGIIPKDVPKRIADKVKKVIEEEQK